MSDDRLEQPHFSGQAAGGKLPASPFKSRLGATFKAAGFPESSELRFDRRNHNPSGAGRAVLCAALVAIGLLGAAWIAVTTTVSATATTEALLPYAAATSSSNPAPIAAFRTTAPTGAAAVSGADAAARNAVESNSAPRARAVRGGGNSTTKARLAAMPLARIASLASANPLRRKLAYSLDFRRIPYAVGFLIPFLIAAALARFAAPSPRLRFVFRFAQSASASCSSKFKPSSRRHPASGPRIADLPQVASVRMARDVGAASDLRSGSFEDCATRLPVSRLRPILSSASDKLWVNFASASDLASAAATAAANIDAGTQMAHYNALSAQAVLEQAEAALALGANTEILFTRLIRDARGSRAAMLAVARLLAQRGKRVVLVDLDFAASSELQDELGLPGEFPGAAEILSRRAKLEDCLLLDDDYPALTAIGACLEGTEISPEQASRLLQSAEMLDLLDELRHENHLVLIHGPAAEDAARALGSRADAALLVIGQQPTEREHRALPDALAEMSAAQANIVGRIEFDDEIV